MATKTYRPVLTEAQIQYLINLLQQAKTPQSLDILGKLLPYQIKISLGAVVPSNSLALQDATKLQNDLGFNLPAPKLTYPIELLMATPDEQLNPVQLEQKNTHKWEAGLMSAEEEAAFLASKGI